MTIKKKSAKSEVLGDARFTEVITLVAAAKGRAYQAVNSELVSLYWSLGEYISRKIESAEWGVVKELAEPSRAASRASGDSRGQTSFGCGNSSRPTARTQESQHC